MPAARPLRSTDPRTIGGYTLTGRLGEGGQGVVFLGTDPSGAQAAVKLLHDDMGEDTGARRRFERELSAVRRVAPFCTARVLAADPAADPPYVVSEYIDGPSLQQAVNAGVLAGPELDRLAIATATALAAIHEAGIVHRDFKPANVLLGPDGPRVIDFGIARPLDASGTHTAHAVGTPAYMSPEQLAGDPAGPPMDMFAWGCTIAFAANGHGPFGSDSIPAIINRIVNQPPDVGSLDGDLRVLVLECLEKEAARRPTARQVLLRLLGGGASDLLTAGSSAAEGPLRISPRPESSTAGTQAPDSQAPVSPPAAPFAPPPPYARPLPYGQAPPYAPTLPSAAAPPPAPGPIPSAASGPMTPPSPWPGAHGTTAPSAPSSPRRSSRGPLRMAAVAAGVVVLAASGVAAAVALDRFNDRPPGEGRGLVASASAFPSIRSGGAAGSGGMARSPRLGLEFWQSGNARGISFASEGQDAGDKEIVRAGLTSDPFELRFPKQGKDVAVMICAWTDDSVFSVTSGGKVTDHPCFRPGTGIADYEYGSGTLYLNPQGHNHLVGDRINSHSAEQDKVYFASTFAEQERTPLTDQNDRLYLSVFVDKNKDGAFSLTGPSEYEFVVLDFDS